ncbi:Dcp1p-Dcp2p decapping enzyme complex alpha subunit, partial [Quaeritorhiza haematococci]
FPGSQPVSFESQHLQRLEREDYFVCEKSDGVRYMLLLMVTPKGPAGFMIDRKNNFHYVKLYFPLPNNPSKFHNETLLDGELIIDVEGDQRHLRYLVFDLIVVNGNSIAQRSFSTRLGILQQDVIKPHKHFMAKHPELREQQPFQLEMKKQERSYGVNLVFADIPKLKHANDGLIFTPVKLPYFPGTCQKLLKWKPPDMCTVDFKIKVIWDKERKPHYQLHICHGNVHKFHDHLTPEPELLEKWRHQSPDNRIAEFRYDTSWKTMIFENGYAPSARTGGWRFVRFRDDKDSANDEAVLSNVMGVLKDGVTREMLESRIESIRANWKARERGIVTPIVTGPGVRPTEGSPPTAAVTTPLTSPTSAAPNPTSSHPAIAGVSPTNVSAGSSSSTTATGTDYFQLPASKRSDEETSPVTQQPL